MKATIERATLLKGLSHVQSVVERRNTIPILSNVLIDATADGQLKLMATDLDLQINESVAAAVDTPGATTVSAHTLFDIARKLPEGSQVSLAAAEGKMTIMAGRARFQLGTLAARRFPGDRRGRIAGVVRAARRDAQADHRQDALRDLDRGDALLSQRHLLARRRRRRSRCSRPPRPTATASRASRCRAPTAPRGCPTSSSRESASPSCASCSTRSTDRSACRCPPSKIRFDLGQALLTSKLIDGTFPDYSRVIPTGNDKILKIDPRSFEEGVDRVSTIATEKTRAVKMALDRDKITLSVTSPENGTAAEEVPGDYAATGFEIGFNSRYLLDILGQIEGDTVEVHLADASAPTLIRENDKSPALYVLMPMRV